MKLETYIEIRAYLWDLLHGTEFLDRTYCVGGCVRDYCLGSEIKDIDLVVEIEGGGIKLANYLYGLDVLKYPPVIYENFGTVSFCFNEFPEYEIEAVQTRSEKYISRDSRNPIVGYGSYDDDWKRRDLTINSLYQPISSTDIYDPSGRGFEDMENRLIRTTSDPEVIFEDDPLRLLRCIRFAVKLGWEIEDNCWKNICNSSYRLSIISRERITSELEKILISGEPKRGLQLIEKSGLLQYISPHLYETTKMTQNKYHVGTVWEHTLEVVDKCTGKNIIVLWAALLHDIGKLETRTEDEKGNVHFIDHAKKGCDLAELILRDFRLPLTDIAKVKKLILHHMDFKSLNKIKTKTLRKLQYKLGRDLYYWLFDLIEADNMSHAPGYCIEGQVYAILKLTELDNHPMFDYKLPINGEDIMRTKNIGPGRLVKGYLEQALKYAYSAPDLSKEELLEKIKHTKQSQLGKLYN